MFNQINGRYIEDNVVNISGHHWVFILLSYFLYGTLLSFIVFVVYAKNLIDFIQIGTNHLIHLTLVASLFLFVVVVWCVIMKAGKTTLSDLGIKKDRFKAGIIYFLLLYGLLNVVLLLLNLFINGEINFYPYWSERGLVYALGYLIGQIFGNVFVEEIFFRGYILNQIIKKQIEKRSQFQSIFLGIIISSTMFAIIHIPIRIYNGITGIDLFLSILILIGLGAAFSLIYVISNNLFFAMAVHILVNISFALFYPIYDTASLAYLIGFGLLFCSVFYRHKNQNA